MHISCVSLGRNCAQAVQCVITYEYVYVYTHLGGSFCLCHAYIVHTHAHNA